MSINIIKPGLLTTIQDCGRFGYQKDGIIVSGAMDKLALRISNLLVGNHETEACIEITQTGPNILFQENCLIAITGGNFSPAIDHTPLPLWRPIYVSKGSLLEFGKPLKGCRAYIAFAGGLVVQKVLGSYSTYLRAGIGGLYGRALQKGDIIPFKHIMDKTLSIAAFRQRKTPAPFQAARWSISPDLLPIYPENLVIRVIRGPEYDSFTQESQKLFWTTGFEISPQSDRMGYRLRGHTLFLKVTAEILSSSVTFGTIQVPASGNPILLMADHQTTGGYPRIGQVASADLSTLAQATPGSFLSFKEISLNEAQQLLIEQEQKLKLIRKAVQLKKINDLLI